RRVARYHQQLDVAPDEQRRGLFGETTHGRGRLRAVRQARGVAEVDDGFVRQSRDELAHDGEPADARVEDADRPIARLAHLPPIGTVTRRSSPPERGLAEMSAGKSARCAPTYASTPLNSVKNSR